jgi:hypothetical protein
VNERMVRADANHLALTVRNDGGRLTLRERYGPPLASRRVIGVFRSWFAVERAVVRYGDGEIAELRRQSTPR